MNSITKRFMRLLQEKQDRGTSPYDTTGTVTRIEGDTVWVHFAGGVDETPVSKTIDCSVGDTVQVRVNSHNTFLMGNATAPPTDDTTAIDARLKALYAGAVASDAKNLAEDAGKLAEENAENMAMTVIRIDGDIENLQSQIDGNITTWFYATDPTNATPPASDWIEEGSEDTHLGDLYYNTISGYVWRWQVINNAYSWGRISDTDVTKALADAAEALDVADSKRRVFYQQPTPPYDAGDLWVQGSGGDILRCSQAKTSSGSYDRNDWVLASKYTDDSALNTWIAGDFANTIEDLREGIVDAKVETYYQSSDPSTSWTTTELKNQHKGDLWYNSTSQKYFRWAGTAWQELTATPPQAVFDSIDGKATIFTGTTTPSNPSKGDLWFKGTNEPILTYVNNSWVEYNKYTDDTAAESARSAADEANSQAMAATGSANAALMQLGVVEDVLGTLSWISQHGTYDQTSDTEVVEGKFYFIQNGSEYQVVTNPTGDPNAQGWYELAGIDEAVTNYVASHLALTDAGLYVQADGIASKLLLSSGGVKIFGPDGSPVAEYGSTAKIGDPNGFHIELSPTELGFYQGPQKVAYISNNQLYITQSVVLERMDLGTPIAQGGLGQWSWKIHKNDNNQNNLYLKWIG